MKRFDVVDLRFYDFATKQKMYCYMQLSQELITRLDFQPREVFEVINQETGHKTAATLTIENRSENKLEEGNVKLSWHACRNLALTVDDRISIRRIIPQKATKVRLMDVDNTIRKINNIHKICKMLHNHIIARGDLIPFKAKGDKINFMVKAYSPVCPAVYISGNTEFSIGF